MAENYFGLTDTGRVRTNNEDAVIYKKIGKDRLILACVIDGVGGYAGGEVAAAIAKETIIEFFEKESTDILGQMQQAFTVANERIAAAKQADESKDSMACVLTLVIADPEKNKFYYAHVGDTRLYLFRDASLIKVSKDHSFVGFLEDSGRLSEEAAMQHPKRNEINKALGFDGTITSGDDYIERGESPFLPGDLLLLCSDGLTDMVNKAHITTILTSETTLPEKATQLVAAANEKGGKDNITVALVFHNKARLKQKATKPPALKKNANQTVESKPEIQPVSLVSKIPSRRANKTILGLSVLSLALLAGLSWALWKITRNSKVVPLPVAVTQLKNGQVAQLQQLINTATTDTLILSGSDFTQPIIISDTLVIDRPHLYLKGLGNIIFTADSAYKGPAFVVSPNNQSFTLDSLLFENFSVAIGTTHKNITLKNVRFNQCKVAVASYLSFPQILYVNGLLTDSSFSVDSIPKLVR